MARGSTHRRTRNGPVVRKRSWWIMWKGNIGRVRKFELECIKKKTEGKGKNGNKNERENEKEKVRKNERDQLLEKEKNQNLAKGTHWKVECNKELEN